VVPPPIVVVVTGTVVVVPPIVVDVVDVVDVVLVVVDEVVVVVTMHGQFSATSCPTAFFRQTSASLAVVLSSPLGSQTQVGEQTSEPTAVLRMNKQSEAVGLAPLVTGWLQSPCAAKAAGGTATTPLNSRAAPRNGMALRMRMVNKAGPPPFVGQSDDKCSQGCPEIGTRGRVPSYQKWAGCA